MALPLVSIDGDVKWNAVQVPHTRGWTVSPTNNAKTYNTNKTKGKVSRRPGPIDITGTFGLYLTDGNSPVLPGTIARLQLYVNATTFWDVVNGVILSIPVDVNIEEGSIENATVNWAFAGKDDATGGYVKMPDGTTLDSTTMGEI